MTEARDDEELLDALGDGFVEAGARPQFPEIPRWVRVANVPDVPLPPIPTLRARRTTGGIDVDGALREPGPRRAGDRVTIQAYRAHHPRTDPIADAKMAAQWPGSSEWLGTTLSPMGNGNVHNPERWVCLELTD